MKFGNFRILFSGIQYRLLAFWDKENKSETLVFATHGIIKKTSKVDKKEIDKAENIRNAYLKNKKKMKSYTLDQAEDLLIGKKGTKERDEYEFELKLELIGDMIKTARKKRKLTQEQLGELVGVKKAQISRLENNTGNVTFETVMRIFNALGAKLNLNLQM